MSFNAFYILIHLVPKVTPGHSHHLLPRTSYEAHYQHPCRQKQPLDARDLAVIYGGERLAASKLPGLPYQILFRKRKLII